MIDKYGTGADPYTYPNTSILVNKLGIRNSNILKEAEAEFTQLAAKNLSYKEPPYDFEYLCDIHTALFGDLFTWAGKIRTIDISKGSTRFCNYSFIKQEGKKIFDRLANKKFLVNNDYKEFSKNLAEFYCDINVLHPFRDGNGRSQRILFEHLCINCGYNLNFSGISAEQWVDANIKGFNGDYSAMEKILEKSLSKTPLQIDITKA